MKALLDKGCYLGPSCERPYQTFELDKPDLSQKTTKSAVLLSPQSEAVFASTERSAPDHQLQHKTSDYALSTLASQQYATDSNETAYPIEPLLENEGALSCHSGDQLIPIRLPSPSPATDESKDAATRILWPLEDTYLFESRIGGEARFELHFCLPLCTKQVAKLDMASMASNRKYQRRSKPTGNHASADNRAVRRYVKFSPEEDELLMQLNNAEERFTKAEIHRRFSETYPGRTCSTLIVRHRNLAKSRFQNVA